MYSLTALTLAQLSVLAWAAPEIRATKSNFQLYAYGDNIGGLPMFTSGGLSCSQGLVS
jgi:hypothetical protein